MTAEPPAELLADGIYRDPSVGRFTRLGLASFAVLALICVGAVASSAVAVIVLIAIALALLGIRGRLARPRLIVRAEGLVVVQRIGQSSLSWSEVAWAGGVPAPPPLAQVEHVLAIRDTGGRELKVSSLRDAIDRARGEAPMVAEMAASLLARAAWSTSQA
jgi:hypothetical protein